MRPEFNSNRLFGITRSKGKMYELGLPERLHIDVPEGSEPQELFILTVGTLGDVAAAFSDTDNVKELLSSSIEEGLNFSASFFDAFLKSNFSKTIGRDTALLASATYYLARRPGSSLVLARQLQNDKEGAPLDRLLHWVLQARWEEYPNVEDPFFGEALSIIPKLLAFHFFEGSGLRELSDAIREVRRRAYDAASPRDLLFIDVISAIIRIRLTASAWATLPGFTGISSESWGTAIRRPEFPKELWPSQILLGQAGLFSGASGVVQMPTSAGKTRSVEIVLRSSFLSGRTKLAVIVAPFRALCHEIGTSLRYAFRDDDVKVNEISDALHIDFMEEISELLGSAAPASKSILVLTPEKFLYILRQSPDLVTDIGVVVYDEGHQFDTGSRGITYELLLTQIKGLLSNEAQTLLISAVIQNAQAVGEWLIGEDAQVVEGSGLLTTARSVAFASWIERMGQLMFFEGGDYGQPDYFVPRVIEQQRLALHGKESKEQYFPEQNNSADIALCIGLRLAPQGAVAIFCGTKASASKIAARAVEIYERDYTIAPPAASADAVELRKMKNLINEHFGDHSISSRAASLGIFVHHGATPQGIRLSIEYAMQKGRINFVACTSTLAQGVNLPIRYLIVSGVYQGVEKIKVRDFQNLVGRAGRSGMHTEGLIIFSDPVVYDKRRERREFWRFNSAIELLSPKFAENTTSSLLGLLAPIRSKDGKGKLQLNTGELCNLLLSDENAWQQWAYEVVRINTEVKFDEKSIVSEIKYRRHLVFAIESYLMANRGDRSFDDFKHAAEQLASETLAYHLASEEQKATVKELFSNVAEYVHQNEPVPEKQVLYSKTLLGVRNAKAIEQWVLENRDFLLKLDSNEKWLEKVWELFSAQSDDKFFHKLLPEALAFELATKWLCGSPYSDLFSHSSARKGTKPWGDKKRSALNENDIVDFCENTLGFECSLVLAAVAQFLFGVREGDDEDAEALFLFQKALKYGLPDWLSISCYERGFADRIIAQSLRDAVKAGNFTGKYFGQAIKPHREQIVDALAKYPSYFDTVLAGQS